MTFPLKFGIALQSEAAFSLLPDQLPRPLTALAVPGEFPGSAELCRKMEKLRQNGVEISIAELASGPLPRIVPEESETVRLEFYRMALATFRKAAAMGIREIGFGADLEKALQNESFRAKQQLLLQGLLGAASELGVRLRLPVRLPLPAGSPGLKKYREKLIGNLPEKCAGITLDFHIHAPGVMELDFAELLRPVRFDSDFWRIVYEPELGNRIVPEKLKAVLEAAGILCRKPRQIIFAPLYSAPELLIQELPEIAETARRVAPAGM